MNQYLLDLLRNNPLTLEEIQEWATRFPHEDCEVAQIPAALERLAVLCLAECVEGTWWRRYPIEVVVEVKAQRTLAFD